jgi:hypothetical protein
MKEELKLNYFKYLISLIAFAIIYLHSGSVYASTTSAGLTSVSGSISKFAGGITGIVSLIVRVFAGIAILIAIFGYFFHGNHKQVTTSGLGIGLAGIIGMVFAGNISSWFSGMGGSGALIH